MSEHTENFQFADPYLEYGVPGFLTSLAQLERYVALTAPLATTPSAVKIVDALLGGPLYRMGEKRVQMKLAVGGKKSPRHCWQYGRPGAVHP
ncbi:MAG: hypothetical protein MH208_07045 [Marinobacter sp.]|nr:hypothetical protein [Marinobacter sp.]